MVVFIIVLVVVAAVTFGIYKFKNASRTIITSGYLSRKNDSIIKNKNGLFFIKEENKESMRKIEPFDLYIRWRADPVNWPSATLHLHSDPYFSMDIDEAVVKQMHFSDDFEKRFPELQFDQLYICIPAITGEKYLLNRVWDKEAKKYIQPEEYHEQMEELERLKKEIKGSTGTAATKMSMVNDGE